MAAVPSRIPASPDKPAAKIGGARASSLAVLKFNQIIDYFTICRLGRRHGRCLGCYLIRFVALLWVP